MGNWEELVNEDPELKAMFGELASKITDMTDVAEEWEPEGRRLLATMPMPIKERLVPLMVLPIFHHRNILRQVGKKAGLSEPEIEELIAGSKTVTDTACYAIIGLLLTLTLSLGSEEG